MKKLIMTLAVATSMLASTAAAAADPGPNTCHRLRNAIASGTPISTLPPRLLRRCFGGNVSSRPTRATPTRKADVQPAPDAASRLRR